MDVAALQQPTCVSLDRVRAFELHSARAWPAPEVLRLHGWEARLTPGSRSRRVNSLNAITPVPGGFPDALAEARRLCQARGLPCTVRLTPLTPPDALSLLATGEAAPAGETIVMAVDLSAEPPPAADGVEITSAATPSWLDGMAASGADAEERALIARLVGAVAMPQGFATVWRDGAAVAFGRAAVENGIAGVFHVATPPEARRRGHGRTMTAALLAWAHRQGAREAYLQVVAENAPAAGLYRGLGFTEAYRYSYLRA
ncbi:acetyltransferase [Alsobacter metallidurans]|uniref:Acetyltransferase n=1 Tax=Alsobacter metallidurans TaxID=340221 RepID=A0A917ICA7_9HYPH|nr:GNAT family N-acetyltransferase [Alsobacter metallidurans]GGH32329.1 acetyltransferase [Alsobacter metallidurans]